MTDVLAQEILGSPISVRLQEKDYPLAFPVYAVTLYRQETAKLNCSRAKVAIEAGRPKLTPAEMREMRSEYRKVAADLDNRETFNDRMEELVAIRARLDEEAGSGDSLFLIVNWWKIRAEDPERIVLALWCGLHQENEDGKWQAPFTLAQLNHLVDFSNVAGICHAITEALGR